MHVISKITVSVHPTKSYQQQQSTSVSLVIGSGHRKSFYIAALMHRYVRLLRAAQRNRHLNTSSLFCGRGNTRRRRVTAPRRDPRRGPRRAPEGPPKGPRKAAGGRFLSACVNTAVYARKSLGNVLHTLVRFHASISTPRIT